MDYREESNLNEAGHKDLYSCEPPPYTNFLIETSGPLWDSPGVCDNRGKPQEPGRVKPEVVLDVLEQAYALGVREVGFYAPGEAFPVPELADYIKRAKAVGYSYVYLISKAAPGTTDGNRGLIDAGLDSIRFLDRPARPRIYDLTGDKDGLDGLMEYNSGREQFSLPFDAIRVTYDGYLLVGNADCKSMLAVADLDNVSLREAWQGEIIKGICRALIDDKLVYLPMAADILHPGHINIIRTAARYGDVMVGLFSDEAIASYKNPPAMDYEARKTVVSSVKWVKYVVRQDVRDYEENLRRYRPKYMVHGTDWREGPLKDVREKAIAVMGEWGGKVIEPEYTKGVSSSELKKKLSRL